MSVSRLPGKTRLVAAFALLGALAAGVAIERSGAIGDEPRKEINPAALRHAQELSEAFNNAADVAMPSVVTVYSKTKAHPVAKSRGARPPGENPFKGTPFEDFFNGRNFDGMTPDQMPRKGMGSGVIIDSSGIVLTNNHVVEGADEVTIHLADGREFKADDVKTDEQTDLAVVRIHGAGNLPAATLGDSDKLRIGDWVIAIGNPFELEQTVSAGIISGTGRELSSVRRARFLQTDAAINPGNSGGPLVNLRGEVIGINTAIATDNGRFQGVGFAIPVNTAKWVTGHLREKGSVQRAYLGIGLEELNSELADKFGAHLGDGVLVAQVFPGTPAAKAGFQPGDIITKFAGQRVKDRSELQSLVERSAVDTKQQVEVLRDGKTSTLEVTAKSLPKDFGLADRRGRPNKSNSNESAAYEAEEIGLEVSELQADRAEELGYAGESGVVVTQVDHDKVSFEKGIREGMLIVKVDKKPVKNVEEFKTALQGQSLKEGILLLVRVPSGANRFVLLKE
jgi:serine protease Do